MKRQRSNRHRRPAATAACVMLAVVLAGPAAAAVEDDFDEQYLQALTALGQGDPPAALERLLAAEVRSAGEPGREALSGMAQRELRVARRVASDSPEHLVPLALLHQHAYVGHLAAGRVQLAVRSRETSVELLELYLARTRRSDADRVVADLLASIGSYLQENSMVSLALALYQRALELAPDSEAPLMGFASAYERQGQYEKVVPYLRRVLDAHPGNREARLRMGINLLRLGRVEEGRRILERIVVAATDDWILSLAYQELARIAVETGDPARGRALLEQARSRLPDDPSLPMQIAFLEDRLGVSADPSRLGQVLRARVVSAQPSPRALYARVVGETLLAAREAAHRHGEQRLGALAESLERQRAARGAGL